MKNIEACEVGTQGNTVFVGTDQPETCRWCGARTDFEELTATLQRHKCLRCQLQYFVEFAADESPEIDSLA